VNMRCSKKGRWGGKKKTRKKTKEKTSIWQTKSVTCEHANPQKKKKERHPERKKKNRKGIVKDSCRANY